MNSSTVATHVPAATGVQVSDELLSVELADGRTIAVPVAWYPRLSHGTAEERNRWQFIGNGRGIHWPALDEAISVENLLQGKPSAESQASFKKWLTTSLKEHRLSTEGSPQTRRCWGLRCASTATPEPSGLVRFSVFVTIEVGAACPIIGAERQAHWKLHCNALKESTLNWLMKALSSSIGKKFIMGITGLLLCGFLAAHLAGNLLLYAGSKAYNDYAHALHKQEGLLKIAETGLVVLFAAHIALAIATARENKLAREQSYDLKQTKQEGRTPVGWPDSWMFISGAVVLAFLILHLSDFTWELRLKGDAGEEPFDKAARILSNSLTFWVYLVGCVILGFHLSHGFASAFQSLGLNHPKYNACIKWFGVLFAIAVGIGFASFPIWAMLRHSGQ